MYSRQWGKETGKMTSNATICEVATFIHTMFYVFFELAGKMMFQTSAYLFEVKIQSA